VLAMADVKSCGLSLPEVFARRDELHARLRAAPRELFASAVQKFPHVVKETGVCFDLTLPDHGSFPP
jgi:hypothetical protein